MWLVSSLRLRLADAAVGREQLVAAVGVGGVVWGGPVEDGACEAAESRVVFGVARGAAVERVVDLRLPGCLSHGSELELHDGLVFDLSPHHLDPVVVVEGLGCSRLEVLESVELVVESLDDQAQTVQRDAEVSVLEVFDGDEVVLFGLEEFEVVYFFVLIDEAFEDFVVDLGEERRDRQVSFGGVWVPGETDAFVDVEVGVPGAGVVDEGRSVDVDWVSWGYAARWFR